MDVKDLLEEAGYQTKRKAATNGGHYSSACPFCKEGDDRFSSWPNESNKNGSYTGGRFKCWRCEKSGDGIAFVRELYGISYREACLRLQLQPKEHRNTNPRPRPKRELPIAKQPPELWQEKALAFTEWSHSHLMSNPQALQLLINRGFTLDTIKKYKFGFNPGKRGKDLYRKRSIWGLPEELNEKGNPKKQWLPVGPVIPTFENETITKVKIRRSAWKEGDKLGKYIDVSGSKSCYSIYGNINNPVALILESEFDAILVQQEAGDLVYCVALGGSTKPLDIHTHHLLKNTPKILFCPDYDMAGAIAFSKWEKDFPNISLSVTPCEKSAGNAFLAGVDLREWLETEIDEIGK